MLSARPQPSAIVTRHRARAALGLALAGLLATACGSSGSGTRTNPAAGTTPGSGTTPAAVAPSGPAASGYTPWPMAERDARHTSRSGHVGPKTEAVRWKAMIGPTTEGPSIAADGTIYAASDSGVLHALNPADGHDRWTFDGKGPIGGDLSTTAAVLPDKTIAWPGSRNTVFGLSPTGANVWSVDVGGVPLSPAVVSSSDFYVMTTSGVLQAVHVDGRTASVRWRLPLGKTSFGSPVIRGDGVIETTVDNSLVAVHDDGGAGKELWRFTVDKQVEVSPAVSSEGVAVLGTDDGFEYGVDAGGKQVWKHEIGTFSYSSPAVTPDGLAYFGDNKGVLTVVRVATGAVVRTLNPDPGSSMPGNIWTAPAIDSEGNVYYGTNDGHVYGWSAGGTKLFTVVTGKTVASYPALSGTGDLLIGSDDGSLYAIGG